MEFDWAIGMYVFLIAIIVAAGSFVALIFRRTVVRNQKRDQQLHQ